MELCKYYKFFLEISISSQKIVQNNYGWIAWYKIGKEEYLPKYFLRLTISPAVNFILPTTPVTKKE